MIHLAAQHPDWVLSFADETWWSRVPQPALHRMRRTMGDAWSRLDGERTATWWRPWKVLQYELTPRITGIQS